MQSGVETAGRTGKDEGGMDQTAVSETGDAEPDVSMVVGLNSPMSRGVTPASRSYLCESIART